MKEAMGSDPDAQLMTVRGCFNSEKGSKKAHMVYASDT